ncbi:BZ3500_MvSof-1268-A1-R1_Chr3-1g05478 [Microbotryum saponariae]|uniref:BZ3500_MvSof-1268-A1-R1_Chr3-1g05478 protein n=1 Tax=Microbotryum saponariae TaxID=289078 RepID=A0A2X0KWU4_9BASI|nr:BZ3500_MvSof-1268-A1-R1_Chr3-1g05478 [Microbotryum saponariae]SDA04669.1 BZ3501_MvSof-1269-A2-R1_Chr3-1g05149 [Microbotryum saponariae]
MPRSSRSSGGRPAARPAAPAPSHQQSRGAHTQAAPPARTTPAGVPAPHAGQPQQPGMLANIASTAAGVGMGSVIGHGVSNMLFGGRSSEAAPVAEPQQQSYDERRMGGSCDIQAKGEDRMRWDRLCGQFARCGNCSLADTTVLYLSPDFTQCLNATGSDMNACHFYLEQLKQCQQAASQY